MIDIKVWQSGGYVMSRLILQNSRLCSYPPIRTYLLKRERSCLSPILSFDYLNLAFADSVAATILILILKNNS